MEMFSASEPRRVVHQGRALLGKEPNPYSQFLQAKLRLEMEMERMRQTHSKEMESRDEEVEEARQSCQKKVWHLDTYYSSLITILK
jgi:hypothetical protein